MVKTKSHALFCNFFLRQGFDIIEVDVAGITHHI